MYGETSYVVIPYLGPSDLQQGSPKSAVGELIPTSPSDVFFRRQPHDYP